MGLGSHCNAGHNSESASQVLMRTVHVACTQSVLRAAPSASIFVYEMIVYTAAHCSCVTSHGP